MDSLTSSNSTTFNNINQIRKMLEEREVLKNEIKNIKDSVIKYIKGAANNIQNPKNIQNPQNTIFDPVTVRICIVSIAVLILFYIFCQILPFLKTKPETNKTKIPENDDDNNPQSQDQ